MNSILYERDKDRMRDLNRRVMRNDTTTHITEHYNWISEDDGVHFVGQCLCRDRRPATVAEKDPKNKHSHCWQTYLLQSSKRFDRFTNGHRFVSYWSDRTMTMTRECIIYYIVSNLFNINLHFVSYLSERLSSER